VAGQSTLLWIALWGLAASPAWGLGVAAETEATNVCFDQQMDAAAFCFNADQFGSAAAAADDAFNGGIEIQFAGDNLGQYFAAIAFGATYQNVTPFPQPLQILSILLPGRALVIGEATARFFIGMEYAPLSNPGSGAFQVHASEMRLDVGALDPVWENMDLTGVPRSNPGDPPFQNAGFLRTGRRAERWTRMSTCPSRSSGSTSAWWLRASSSSSTTA